MATPKQLAANRKNAEKCTGPRTPLGAVASAPLRAPLRPLGKARSRWNAIKHGILATALIPPSLEPFEMPHTLESLLAALREHFDPFGPVEGMLVEIVAVSYWRLAAAPRPAPVGECCQGTGSDGVGWNRSARLLCAEGGASARATRIAELRRSRHAAEVAAVERALQELSTAEAGPDPFTAHLLARRQAELPRLAAEDPEPELDRAALPGREDMLAFSRYEAQIQRQLHRALFVLERLQQARGFTPGRPSQQQGELDGYP